MHDNYEEIQHKKLLFIDVCLTSLALLASVRVHVSFVFLCTFELSMNVCMFGGGHNRVFFGGGVVNFEEFNMKGFIRGGEFEPGNRTMSLVECLCLCMYVSCVYTRVYVYVYLCVYCTVYICTCLGLPAYMCA